MNDFDFKKAHLTPGFRAVEAGAGTGKTYSLVWIVVRLLLERRKEAKEILMVTFTDAAALEMRQRLREFLEAIDVGILEPEQQKELDCILSDGCSWMKGDAATRLAEARRLAGKALNQLGRMSITTIHGFSQSAFAEHAVNAGFAPMEGTPVDGGAVAEVIASDWLRSGRSTGHKLSEVARAVRVLMADPDCDVGSLTDGKDLTDFVRRRIEEGSVVTFDDLILRLRNALIPGKRSGATGADDLARAEELTGRLRESYSCCLIDEFQDTDAAQWDIFWHLFGKDATAAGSLLMVVGDPKQAIYGFRGADLHTYLQAVRQSEGGEGSTLRRNFRSTPEMIAFFNSLFGHDKYFGEGSIKHPTAEPRKKELVVTKAPTAKPVRLFPGKSSQKVAAEVRRLLETQPADKTVGVLVRSNRLGNALHRALVEQGTPAALESTQSVYETTTAFQVSLLLRAVLRPGDSSARKAILLSRPALFGPTPAGIIDIGSDQSSPEVLKAHSALSAWLSECRETWDKLGFPACWEKLTRTAPKGPKMVAVRESLARCIFRSRALVDLNHVGEHLASIQASRRLDPEQLLNYLQEKVEQTAEGEDGAEDEAAPDECLRLESAKPRVVVQTIHKSKGLEYDSVVLVIHRPGKAPNFPGNVLRGSGNRTLTTDAKKQKGAKDLLLAQDRDENARLLYVAITRAKSRLSIFNDTVPADVDPDKEYGFHHVLRSCGVDPATWTDLTAPHGKDGALPLRDLVEHAPAERAESVETASPRKAGAPSEGALAVVADEGPAVETLGIREKVKLAHARGTSSFTGLTGKSKHSKVVLDPNRAEDEEDEHGEIPEVKDELLIPETLKGAGFGTVMHELLEELDMEKDDKDQEALARNIALRLEAESLPLPEGEDDWEAISARLARSCTTWLDGKLLTAPDTVGHRVRELKPGRCLHEVRFAMRGRCDKERLDALSKSFGQEFKDHAGMAKLNLGQIDLDGLLTGVIDLAYEHEGRYYILDWKTNHLGSAPEDYGKAGTDDGIARSTYHLQYSLYTAALDLHLEKALGDKWSYDSEGDMAGKFSFGGVQYVFLRAFGLREDGLGCHYRRPSKDFIKTLQKILTQ